MNMQAKEEAAIETSATSEMSAEIGEIAKALASAQASFRVATQDGLNPHFHSKFATLSSIMAAAQPALSQSSLAVLQLPSMDGKQVSVQTLLAHSSGQWISCSLTATARDAQPQAVGSVISYLRRYGLASLLGIATGEDDDGEGAQRVRTIQAPRPEPSPKPRPTEYDAAPQPASKKETSLTSQRSKTLARLHAIAGERGLSHEQVTQLLGVDSMKLTSLDILDAASDLLSAQTIERLGKQWGEVDRSMRLRLSRLKDHHKATLLQAGK